MKEACRLWNLESLHAFIPAHNEPYQQVEDVFTELEGEFSIVNEMAGSEEMDGVPNVI